MGRAAYVDGQIFYWRWAWSQKPSLTGTVLARATGHGPRPPLFLPLSLCPKPDQSYWSHSHGLTSTYVFPLAAMVARVVDAIDQLVIPRLKSFPLTLHI